MTRKICMLRFMQTVYQVCLVSGSGPSVTVGVNLSVFCSNRDKDTGPAPKVLTTSPIPVVKSRLKNDKQPVFTRAAEKKGVAAAATAAAMTRHQQECVTTFARKATHRPHERFMRAEKG